MNPLTLKTHLSAALLWRLLVAGLAALLLAIVPALPTLAASGTWTTTGSLHTARHLHMMTRLQNGQVLVAGGASFNGTTTTTLASAELYNPSTGTWTTTGSLNVARVDATMTLLSSGQVLVAGGYYYDPVQGPIALASAELYNPATGTWTYTGSLNVARYNHTATLLQNGQVLVAGGNTGVFVGLDSAELYNPASGTWTTTGSMTTVRRGHTMTLLANGQVLVAGGADGAGTYLASAELYDPASGSWTTTGSMNVAHASYTATLLTGGQVLVAGGVSYNGYSTATSELYTP